MRRAAISAGLVKDMSEALKRVSFVTEGEASLHFCLTNALSAFNEYVGLSTKTFSHAYID